MHGSTVSQANESRDLRVRIGATPETAQHAVFWRVPLLFSGVVEVLDEWGEATAAYNFTNARHNLRGDPLTSWHYVRTSDLRYLGDYKKEDRYRRYWFDSGQGPLPNGPIAAAFLLLLLPLRGPISTDQAVVIGNYSFSFTPEAQLVSGPLDCRWNRMDAAGRLRANLTYHVCITSNGTPVEAAYQDLGGENPALYLYDSAATHEPVPLAPEAPPSEPLEPPARRPWDTLRIGTNSDFPVPPVGPRPHDIEGMFTAIGTLPSFQGWLALHADAYAGEALYYWKYDPVGAPPPAPSLPGDLGLVSAYKDRDVYHGSAVRVRGDENRPSLWFPLPTGSSSTYPFAARAREKLPAELVPLEAVVEWFRALVPHLDEPDATIPERHWIVQGEGATRYSDVESAYWIVAESCSRLRGGQLVADPNRPYFVASAPTGQLLISGIVRSQSGCGTRISDSNYDDGSDAPIHGPAADTYAEWAWVKIPVPGP